MHNPWNLSLLAYICGQCSVSFDSKDTSPLQGQSTEHLHYVVTWVRSIRVSECNPFREVWFGPQGDSMYQESLAGPWEWQSVIIQHWHGELKSSGLNTSTSCWTFPILRSLYDNIPGTFNQKQTRQPDSENVGTQVTYPSSSSSQSYGESPGQPWATSSTSSLTLLPMSDIVRTRSTAMIYGFWGPRGNRFGICLQTTYTSTLSKMPLKVFILFWCWPAA